MPRRMTPQERAESIEARSHPEPNTGCSLWLGATNAKGYGIVGSGRGSALAHRLAWTLFRGPIPDGLLVLHRCDMRCCVNPVHLFLGTQVDNMADMKAKGRAAKGDATGTRKHPECVRRGSASPRAKLSETDLPAIRRRRDAGEYIHTIAADYGVHPSVICRILTGKTWKHSGIGRRTAKTRD